MSNKDEEEKIIIRLFNEDSPQIITPKNTINHFSKLDSFEENFNNEKEIKLDKNASISILKIFISEIINVSSEKIHLFVKEKSKNKTKICKNNKNNIIIIKNMEINKYMINKLYMEELKDDIDGIGKYLDILDYKNIIDNYPCLYYIISSENIDNTFLNYSVSVIIDLYQQNIDKIFLTLQSNCSLFLLKNIINSKLNHILNITQLKLICIDITQLNIDTNSKALAKNSNNVFSDRKTLNDIITFFYPIHIGCINMKYTIHFLLTIKNNIGSSEQIGLNFRFNYLKEVNKISFNKDAPEYCECSDGINLFAFCFNQECPLFNKYFVINLGYGLFNILKQSKKIKCPKCGDNNNIEIKNIGIINSKYFYSGKLKVKESEKEKGKSSFEGDGITLDDKLYIFKEAKINSFLVQLYIEAKPHFIIENKNFKSKRTKEEEELDDIALCDNNIDVNINKKKYYNNNALHTLFTASTLGFDKYISGISSKSPQRFLKNTNLNNNNYQLNNSNKVKIYENESEILEKNDDIIVDKFDDKSINNVNSINCIGDADIFSGGCFSTKKENEFRNNIEIEKSSFCFIF